MHNSNLCSLLFLFVFLSVIFFAASITGGLLCSDTLTCQNVTNCSTVNQNNYWGFRNMGIICGCFSFLCFIFFCVFFMTSSSSKDNSHKKCCGSRCDDFASNCYYSNILPILNGITAIIYIPDEISSSAREIFYPLTVILLPMASVFYIFSSNFSLQPIDTLSFILLFIFIVLSSSLRGLGEGSVSQIFVKGYVMNDDGNWTQEGINAKRMELFQNDENVTRIPGPTLGNAIILVIFNEKRFWFSKLLSLFVHLGIVLVASIYLTLRVSPFIMKGALIFLSVCSGIQFVCICWWMFLALIPTGYSIYTELVLSKGRNGYTSVSTWGFNSDKMKRWYYVSANIEGWVPNLQ